MSLYDLKPRFQDLLRPVVATLARRGVAANAVTLAGVLLSASAGAAVAAFPTHRWPLIALALAVPIRLALNAIDGMLAREHGQASPFGAIANEVADVASDMLLFLPLLLVPALTGPLLAALVCAGAVAEVAGLSGPLIGASRRYDGPMGKADRAALLAILAAAMGFGAALPPWLIQAVLTVAVALVAVTVVRRLRAALSEVAARASE